MDILDLSRIFFALIAVLGMIGLCAMIAKKAGLVSGAVGLAKKRRLQLVETLPLDARRRAAIIRNRIAQLSRDQKACAGPRG